LVELLFEKPFHPKKLHRTRQNLDGLMQMLSVLASVQRLGIALKQVFGLEFLLF
jgi:hypothetical protein